MSSLIVIVAMQFFSLDAFIIYLYLILILYIGIKARGKVRSLKDYALSKKNFSTPTIIATIFATAVGGGSTLGLAEKAFSVGIIFLLPAIANFIGYIFYAYVVLYSKMLVNNDSISVGELVGKFYGNNSRIITGVLAICVSLGYLSAQISSMGYIFSYFFNVPYILGIFLGYGIVIVYTTIGGMRSVIFTDIIQFGVMIVAIPLLFNVGISKIGGISNLIVSVPVENLSLTSNKMSVTEIITSCIIFSFVGFNPSFIQRFLIVKDNKQAFYSIFLTASITIPFFLIVIGIGLISLAMDPNLNPNLAFPYLVDHILPAGLKGFVIAGLLSAMMSTADSGLNLIGITAINDIFIPLTSKKFSSDQYIKLARIATFVFGLVSIGIPLYFRNIFDIILFFTIFWAPTLLVPIVMALINKRVSTYSFYICLFSSILSIVIYKYYTNDQYGAGQIIGVFTNLTIFVICYLTENKNRSLANGL